MALAVLVAALVPAVTSAGTGSPRPGAPGPPGADQRSVAAFYYAWYGTPEADGGWLHWDQGRRRPPLDIGTTSYPSRGPYSSSDPTVLAAQMAEIAAAGIDTIIVSWWGAGSHEDAGLPAVTAAARHARLAVAIHLEPYAGRTPTSVAADIVRLRQQGIRDFYVYDSALLPDAQWAAALGPLTGVRVFANTSLVGRARAGRFQGIYTYDVLLNEGSSFARICRQARRVGVACAPSVGPGFDARRATTIAATRPRRDGTTYDVSWRSAIDAGADVITITSYNEWHEGTQIEPARVAEGYASYDGAYGRSGPAAESAYLDRTRQWADHFRGVAPAPAPPPPLPLSILP